jgi:hypothetical protein
MQGVRPVVVVELAVLNQDVAAGVGQAGTAALLTTGNLNAVAPCFCDPVDIPQDVTCSAASQLSRRNQWLERRETEIQLVILRDAPKDQPKGPELRRTAGRGWSPHPPRSA